MALASGRLSRRLLPCWMIAAAVVNALFEVLPEAPVSLAFTFGASSLLAIGSLWDLPAKAAIPASVPLQNRREFVGLAR